MSTHYYHYQACDAQGNMTSGQVSAESEREAVAQLQARRLVPIRIKTAIRRMLITVRPTAPSVIPTSRARQPAG